MDNVPGATLEDAVTASAAVNVPDSTIPTVLPDSGSCAAAAMPMRQKSIASVEIWNFILQLLIEGEFRVASDI